MNLRWGLVILSPFMLGLVAAVGMELGWLPNPAGTISFRFDLVGIIIRLGIGLSVLLGLAGLGVWWNTRNVRQAQLAERENQRTGHRNFLKRLDHELKNPLTIIQLGVANLRDSLDLTPEQSQSLSRIGQQVQRLQKLVVDLRWLADLEEGNIEPAPVELEDVLEEAIHLVREGTQQPHRAISLHLQETPWRINPVSGDRELLVLMFRNLIENAVKFTGEGARIEVRASENGHTAIVEVADTGPGVPEEEQSLIFENLYRGKNAHGTQGSGMGLPLVQRIVALHGGSISIRSRPKSGTIFTVALRLAEVS